MKKIIKIAALILALLCIGTSFASCGESKEELANNIRDSMVMNTYRKYQGIDEIKTSNFQIFGATEIFNPLGKSISEYGQTINRPVDFQKDYKVSIKQEEKKVIINLHTQVQQFWKVESIVFEIFLPCKVKSTNKGTILSDNKNAIILEYKLENIKAKVINYRNSFGMLINNTMEKDPIEIDGYAVIDEIIIKY